MANHGRQIDKRLKEWSVGVTGNNFTSVYPEILAFFCYNLKDMDW
jgi:hypothetical protein